jgi:hypothetical protein
MQSAWNTPAYYVDRYFTDNFKPIFEVRFSWNYRKMIKAAKTLMPARGDAG